MTDAYGRLLVLRPDSTLPIARIAATRLKGAELPIRLYYNQNVFSRRKKLTGRNDETSQSGIELIGVNGIRADIEVIETAIEALKVCGAPDYKIEIGHAGFFKALCDELSAPQEVKTTLTSIWSKKTSLRSIQCLIRSAATGLPRLSVIFRECSAEARL